jgi:hypothetical protein
LSLNIQFADWVVGWARRRLEELEGQVTGDGPGRPKNYEEYLAKLEIIKLLREFVTACEKEARRLQG